MTNLDRTLCHNKTYDSYDKVRHNSQYDKGGRICILLRIFFFNTVCGCDGNHDTLKNSWIAVACRCRATQ